MGGMALMGDEQDRARAYEAWGSFGVSRPGHGFKLQACRACYIRLLWLLQIESQRGGRKDAISLALYLTKT